MPSTTAADPMTLLEDLLRAAKGAERLISVMFELKALQGEPFVSIWSHLEKAIDNVEVALWKDERTRQIAP